MNILQVLSEQSAIRSITTWTEQREPKTKEKSQAHYVELCMIRKKTGFVVQK